MPLTSTQNLAQLHTVKKLNTLLQALQEAKKKFESFASGIKNTQLHQTIISLVCRGISASSIPALPGALLTAAIAPPLCIAIAIVFHRVIEVPMLQALGRLYPRQGIGSKYAVNAS